MNIKMKKMCSIILMGVKIKLVYKNAALLKILISGLNVIILYLFWKALYPDDLNMQLYMIRYAALSHILSTFYIIESSLSNNVRNGNIVISLLKPWNYILVMFQENIGKMIGNFLLVGLPTFIICSFTIGFNKLKWINFLWFEFSVLLAFTIMFLIRFLVELSCFWIIEAWSLIFLADVIIRIFSGSFIPSFIMPTWFQTLMKALPFIWIYEMPLRVFLEDSEILNASIPKILLLQLFWISLLVVIIKVIWNRGLNKITIQGG